MTGPASSWCVVSCWPFLPRIRSAEAGTVQGGLRLGSLVPRDRAVGADDRALVALAGEKHDVAGSRPFQRRIDRRAAVGDDEEVVIAALAGGLRPAGDGIVDDGRVLAAGVLVGDDDDAGTLARDAS